MKIFLAYMNNDEYRTQLIKYQNSNRHTTCH